MLLEIKQRGSYLENEPVKTIYFGGGTPSFLADEFLEKILEEIHKNFTVERDAEITLECNPDDITAARLNTFKSIGINRFSMGVQSFDDDVLKFMNRAHTSREITESIDLAKAAGFENITVDLIYGIPGKKEDYWKQQLDHFLKLDVPHLSSYCLTIEPKTYFGSLQKKGVLNAAPDENSLAEFQYLMDFTKVHGYEHYEISNFAKPGFISRHNSAYWLGEKYLGIGPSAHSYNQQTRGWNVANNTSYIQALENGTNYHEVEELTVENRCNDYLLTRLRTKWGVDLSDLEFIGKDRLLKMQNSFRFYAECGWVEVKNDVFVLTDNGKYRADGLAADLFI